MSRSTRFLLAACAAASVLCVAAPAQTLAQTGPRKPVPARITQPLDENKRVSLPKSAHPLARPQFDRGPAPASLAMNRMILVLKRSPEQQKDLASLLADQLKPGSASFHHWLTPEQFGARFGIADQDLQAVSTWLQTHGFTLGRATKGKSSIEFSGTAGQVRAAFRTEIHRFAVKGKPHWANAGPVSIPTSLSPVIEGVASLNDFESRSTLIPVPNYNELSGNHALSPADFATIYNLNPLYTAKMDGTGSTIALMGRSNINVQDIVDFRTQFGLAANPPTVVLDGADPGSVSGDQLESVLDVSWAGAVAPGATVKLITSASAFSDGILLSEVYVIDNNAADIVSESYSICENDISEDYDGFIEFLREQAAAEGITFIVSADDSGPYGCDSSDDLQVSDPTDISVNANASSTYVTAVGGTQFNEGTTPATYWATTNAAGFGSALSYIPELPWDESCGDPFCFNNIAAGGGGSSAFISKPSWQTGVVGIPDDNARDIPDVSLSAGTHDPYLLCYNKSCYQKTCPPCFYGVGGTSASAPSFAGIVAILKQKVGTRLGSINPGLYTLAATETYSTCNSDGATLPPSNCIYNDITTGSNAVNGESGFGTDQAVYQATVGYDLATGLGTLNATNFVNNWKTPGTMPTTTTLTLTPTTLVHGQAANVSIGVTSLTGVPTGPVDLNGGTTTAATTASFDSFFLDVNGAVSTTEQSLAGGTYMVSAVYGGDSTFAPSTSTPVSVTVTPETSIVTLQPAIPCGSNQCTYNGGPYGGTVLLGAFVSGSSGFGNPSGTLTFSDNGTPVPNSTTPLNAFGIAIAPPVYSLTAGTHTIVATYSGDASFQAGTSAPAVFAIDRSPSSIVLAPASACAAPGGPITLTLTLNTPSNGPVAPTGTFTVLSANPQVTATLVSTSPGTATLTIPSLPAGVNDVVVAYSGDGNYLPATATTTVNVTSGGCVGAVVNSASYGTTIAPGALVSIFGSQLGTTAVAAGTSVSLKKSKPADQVLGGASVNFTDSTGFTQPADLDFVAPSQINCVVPSNLAFGTATVQITTASGPVEYPVQISPIAPSLFSANGSGKGLAAANLVRVAPDGTVTYEPVISVDASGNITARPIVFNGDELALALYGTGMENLNYGIGVYISGRLVIPQYVGPSSFEGLDQVNIDLPPTLAGSGSRNLQVLFEDENFHDFFSNVVTVTFQ